MVGNIVLVRHGQTEWSLTGQHTSVTDLDLTSEGEIQVGELAPVLATYDFTAVWSSPMRRTLHTARLAKLEVTAATDDLVEWNYGSYEGVTTTDIHVVRPEWTIWRDGCPDGETPDQIGARLDRVLASARPLLSEGDVALIGHGHALRVAAARWIGLPVAGGALLSLNTASLSVLGYEREQPVLRHWNIPLWRRLNRS